MTAKPKDEPVDAEAVEDVRPSGAELVIADPSDETNVFRVLDAHDEDLILAELQRRQLDVMLYDFPQDGKRVVDLSYAGVLEAVRVINATGNLRIKIDKGSLQVESVVEDVGDGPEPCWIATVYGEEETTGYGLFGTYVQPKRKKLKKETAARKRKQGAAVGDDDKMANPFARQNAINKAQRNALRVHIPEPIRQALIAQYVNDPARVKRIQIGAGAAEAAELPPALTDAEGEAKIRRARELYDQVREAAPGGVAVNLLPGRFHQMLSKSWGSHAALDEFVAFMEAAVDAAKEKAA